MIQLNNITGNSTEKGLDPYDSGDDTELKMSFTVHRERNASNYSLNRVIVGNVWPTFHAFLKI